MTTGRKPNIKQNINFFSGPRRLKQKAKMTFLNIITAFANMFLNTQKWENLSRTADVFIHIHTRFYNNINVCTQSPGSSRRIYFQRLANH